MAKKKIFSIFAALTLSVGLWAEAPANAESVDLGLPSGLKWATFNVGATAPEGYGDYFAWGEVEPYYSSQDPLTWKTGKETGYSWQSYCGASDFTEWSTAPYDATTNILKPEFDAATANWGSDWRMPTKEELDELRTECIWTQTQKNGIYGYEVKGTNGNTIFFPASGYRDGSSLREVGTYSYWSSLRSEYDSYYAFSFRIDPVFEDWYRSDYCYGRSVRPVTTKLIVPVPKVGDQFVDTTSVLKFEVTAVGDTNTVKVMKNDYSGTSYTVPDTVKYLDVDFAVTEIGMEAFALRSSLESITLPAGLTTIGKDAFSECSSLQSITIPESVTTIGVGAFYECTSLESITLPAGLTTIENEVFNNCEKLQSIIIPADVTTIGEIAFAGSGLQTITIPAGVISLEMGAFAECAGLTSVTFLGNACQGAIGEDAFYEVGEDAPALLTLPNSWTGTLPDEDGNWYGGLFELYEEPAPGPAVGDTIIDATSGLKFEVTAVGEANTVKVISNGYTGTSYTVPATVKHKEVDFAVTEIGESAFKSCSTLQSVTIAASVTAIGANAFGMCSALTSVTFLGNACQEGIAANAFMMVGYTTSVLLTLPDNWGEDRPVNNQTPWHSGLFEYEVPVLGDKFVDATSGLKFEVTAVGEANTVKVISNGYTGTSYTVPATVKHKEVDFAVTEIGASAFSRRNPLQSITIPASVTTIGEKAFESCSALTSVTLSEGLTTIGASAFERCSKLTPITIPASVTTIGRRAFHSCSALQSVTIPASVTTIGSQAFYSCSALTSVTFADGSQLTTIGAEAFISCSKLQTVTLPAALKSIGSDAFNGCSKLTPIAFPASLDTIGAYAFSGCTALESITIPASVDTIGEAAFSRCTGLTSIVVEAGNTKYDSRDNCNGIVEKATNTLIAACKNTIIPNTVTILGSYVFQSQPITTITIPASVTTIGEDAFSSCSALQSVTIPASVTTIGEFAFNRCSALQSITIPANVTTIGKNAFESCSALQSVTFAEGSQLTTIGMYAFYYSGLTSITIPAGVTEIEDVFTYCYHLTTVNFAKDAQIKRIGKNAFRFDTALTSVTLPEGLMTIGGSAFSESGLTSITIPASVTTIVDNAFEDCYNVQSITFTDGTQLQTIGVFAFKGCKSLPSITIPASVTKLGRNALRNCTQLTSVTFEEGTQLTEIEEGVFLQDSALTSITIPASVTKLGVDVFGHCVQLASVTFEEGSKLTSIGLWCFHDCPLLTSIDIPLTVAEMGEEVFIDCSALADVTVHWTDAAQLPTLNYDVFKNIAAGAKLHVPAGTTAIYEAAEQWKDFTIVEESDPDPKVVRDTLDAVSACGSYVWEIYGKQLTLTESGFYNDTTIIEDSVITTLPLTILPNVVDELPALVKYDSWLLVVDRKGIEDKGISFTADQVQWYRVEGEVDEYPFGENNDTQIGTGDYYTIASKMSGKYYALIDVDVTHIHPCAVLARTIILDCDAPKSSGPMLAPTIVQAGGVMTLSNLSEGESNISIYTTAGQLIRNEKVCGQTEHKLHAEGASGIYLLQVTNKERNDVFKYVITH